MLLLSKTKNSMIKLADRLVCTGCSVCAAACRFGAIEMLQNAEGFLYPRIDKSKCKKCGACSRACPVLDNHEERQPLETYAANALDDELRMESSSGGVFSLLAKDVLGKKGVVFGAAFDHDDWHVYHKPVDNESDLRELRGSKYLQSVMGDCYVQAKEWLWDGKTVLFSGTPCQIAGLRHFIALDTRIPKEKLLLVDVVCHAVPSPLAWRRYLETRIDSAYINGVGGLELIRSIASRSKNFGWKQFSLSLLFANGKEYCSTLSQDAFLRGFLAELYNRPSCHCCPFKNLKSGSDLTIADYWGVGARFPELDDDRGTSLVLINTDKGLQAFERIKEMIKFRKSDYEHAIKGNPNIARATIKHRNRERFFKKVNVVTFDKLVAKMLQPPLPPLKTRIRSFVGRQLRRMGLLK